MTFEHKKDARRIAPASKDLVQRNGHPLPLLRDEFFWRPAYRRCDDPHLHGSHGLEQVHLLY